MTENICMTLKMVTTFIMRHSKKLFKSVVPFCGEWGEVTANNLHCFTTPSLTPTHTLNHQNVLGSPKSSSSSSSFSVLLDSHSLPPSLFFHHPPLIPYGLHEEHVGGHGQVQPHPPFLIYRQNQAGGVGGKSLQSCPLHQAR